jgi:AAA15 family ATPase/GTPase
VFFALLYEFFDMEEDNFWIRDINKLQNFEVIFHDRYHKMWGNSLERSYYVNVAQKIRPGRISYDSVNYSWSEMEAAFIPAKEMLTHARIEKDYTHRKLPLDGTLIDIINKAGVSVLRQIPTESQKMLNDIEKIIGGKVVYKNDAYYIVRDGIEYNFRVEAEGYKKLALLLRLIETGVLSNNSILIWDEPESNINPKNIPILVDTLLALQRAGVQIFAATHDYLFPKYLEIRRNSSDNVLFHSFSKECVNGPVTVESDTSFAALENNDIINQPIKLYEETIEKGME